MFDMMMAHPNMGWWLGALVTGLVMIADQRNTLAVNSIWSAAIFMVLLWPGALVLIAFNYLTNSLTPAE